MSNVVNFPKRISDNVEVKLPENEEEFEMSKQMYHKKYIDFMVSEIVPQVVSIIAHEGYDINNDECLSDAFLFSEAIQSMLCKSLGYKHPLQDFADKYLEEHIVSEEVDKGTDI